MLKTIKMTLLILLGLIVAILIAITLFVNFHPAFGANPEDEQRVNYAQRFEYFEDNRFANPNKAAPNMSFGKILRVMSDYLRGDAQRQPDSLLPVVALDAADIAARKAGAPRLTWFGHSAFLLEISGQKLLIDPMFGDVPAPHPRLGARRFQERLPIDIEQLPPIDAVLLSHDHYDHLDYGSISRLRDKVKQFYVPLGVGNHLQRWGIAPERIHELAWWEEIQHEGLTFACTPAQHFSGRGPMNRNTTLWASWVINAPHGRIFFSGDSGYGPHFKEIGERYGPFDIALMECGQYNENWTEVHMMPEQTAQACLDVGGQVLLPIHWGTFRLAMHSWTEPVERVINRAQELGIRVTTPRVGQAVDLHQPELPSIRWWEQVGSEYTTGSAAQPAISKEVR